MAAAAHIAANIAKFRNLLMLSRAAQRRGSARRMFLKGVSIRFHDGRTRHGLLRDVSRNGLFFYTDTQPGLGTKIEILAVVGDEQIVCAGRVVRVVEPAAGAAIGIAIHARGRQTKRLFERVEQ